VQFSLPNPWNIKIKVLLELDPLGGDEAKP